MSGVKWFISGRNIYYWITSEDPKKAEKGWEWLYRRYYPTVRRWTLTNNGTEQDAVDVFHDGLLILHRNLKNGKFKGESTIGTYLFAICKNLWRKRLHIEIKHLTFDGSFDIKEEDTDYLNDIEIVNNLMKRLSVDCRRMLTDYYLKNHSMSELKDLFQLGSVQAAKNKKCRCLSYLVKLVKTHNLSPEKLMNNE